MRLAVSILAFACAAAAAAASEIGERVLKVPVKFEDAYRKKIERDITVTVFEPGSGAPFPLAVVNHGRPANDAARHRFGRARYAEAARYLASLGFSVWVPTRVGYGASGTEEDPEYTGPCGNKNYPPGYAAAVEQVVQVIEHARRESSIDASRTVAVGQSFGGALSVALAARNIQGLLATVNFAGGGGGNPDLRPGEPCAPGQLADLFGAYGRTARVPTLWIYAENDRYFAPPHVKRWYEAFRAQGGAGELLLLPPFGDEGHLLFSRGLAVWKPLVEPFLLLHLSRKAP